MSKQTGPPLSRAATAAVSGVDRLRGGLVLRACLLLTALSVCAHVYLERVQGGRGAAPPAPLPLASLHHQHHHPGDGDRPEAGTTGPPPPGRPRDLGRGASYVQKDPEKDPSVAREMEGGGEEGRPRLRPHKKVNDNAVVLTGGGDGGDDGGGGGAMMMFI
ncbi:hypothetical protein CRUP_004909 [Coryphaenoides rupestris]|nr:hypothetical protein CRUP_004909 [Coryphaenoides rupestris]